MRACRGRLSGLGGPRPTELSKAVPPILDCICASAASCRSWASRSTTGIAANERAMKDRSIGIVAHLLARGPVIRDGDTLGRSADAEVVARLEREVLSWRPGCAVEPIIAGKSDVTDLKTIGTTPRLPANKKVPRIVLDREHVGGGGVVLPKRILSRAWTGLAMLPWTMRRSFRYTSSDENSSHPHVASTMAAINHPAARRGRPQGRSRTGVAAPRTACPEPASGADRRESVADRLRAPSGTAGFQPAHAVASYRTTASPQ